MLEAYGVDTYIYTMPTQIILNGFVKAVQQINIEYRDKSGTAIPLPAGTLQIDYLVAGSEVSQVAMSKYYRSSLTYTPPGIVPINDYNTGVGQMLLNNKYTDYYAARRNPTVIDSRHVCSTTAASFTKNPYNIYWEGASVYIKGRTNTYLYVDKLWIQGTNMGSVTRVLWTPDKMYDPVTGFLSYYDTGQFTIGYKTIGSLNIPATMRVEINPLPQAGTPNSTKYQIRIKGGVYGGFSSGGSLSSAPEYILKNWTDVPLWEGQSSPPWPIGVYTPPPEPTLDQMA